MLELNIIRELESDYYSSMLLVESPENDPRHSIHYRKLNAVIKVEYNPLSNIEERLERVSSAKYITVLDLTKGYWLIPMTPRAQTLAAFITSSVTYFPLKMPFGLINSSFRFSKFMKKILRGLEKSCLLYLDDMAISSETQEEHQEHVRTVLIRIREAKLTVKIAK